MPDVPDALESHYLTLLLQAAHAFFEEAGSGRLTVEIELRTAQVLGVPEAKILMPQTRAAIDQDISQQLGLSGGFSIGTEISYTRHTLAKTHHRRGLLKIARDLGLKLQGSPDHEIRSTLDSLLASRESEQELDRTQVEPLGPELFRHQLEALYTTSRVICGSEASPEAKIVRQLFPGNAACVSVLRTGRFSYGILAALDEQRVRTFTERDIWLLDELATFAAQALSFDAVVEERESRDGLTGLYDQRYFKKELERKLSDAIFRQEPLAVVMIDIDHFKAINDTAGHGAGDSVIRLVGAHLIQMSRTQDVAVRYGGEEFAMILTKADENAAAQFAERLRKTIFAQEAKEWGGWKGAVTISCGVAGWEPGVLQNADSTQLATVADQALYRAKRSGRNRVCRASRLHI